MEHHPRKNLITLVIFSPGLTFNLSSAVNLVLYKINYRSSTLKEKKNSL